MMPPGVLSRKHVLVSVNTGSILTEVGVLCYSKGRPSSAVPIVGWEIKPGSFVWSAPVKLFYTTRDVYIYKMPQMRDVQPALSRRVGKTARAADRPAVNYP